ncbi:uncharacterized protein LOC110462218 isoform X3 [Mizuhopecten yessoensis]|uniref:uncharacterized protein LOC110462218 isoform X3 n=1 Tax=Mizuhopecten yessoensis TaxID=6573 RepID=UPI000B459135|nr:uncharacterized protein LOC110462218 isoform X3 [Mizuhopecten yessoensis]
MHYLTLKSRNMKVHSVWVIKVLTVLILLTLDADGVTKGHGIIDGSLCLSYATVSHQLSLYHANVTWEHAFTACQEMSSFLAMPVTRDEVNACQEIIGPREHVWVGEYAYHTPWMYPTGCYRSNGSQYTRIKNNDLATCKRICGDSDMLISKYKCVCVEKASDVAARENLSECDVTCYDNGRYNCGGNVFLHYSTYDDVANKTWLYPLRDYNGTVLYLRYDEAEDLCKRNGSLLAAPTTLHELIKKAEDPIRYWIGARRKTAYVQSIEGLPASITDPTCLYIMRLSSRVTDYRRKECHQPSSYLCRTNASTMTNSTDGDSHSSKKEDRVVTIAIISTVIAVLIVLILFVIVRSKRIKLGRNCCLVTTNTHTENILLQLTEHADYYHDNLDKGANRPFTDLKN